jgi:hypothetical protein
MRTPKALLLASLFLASTSALQGCVVVAVAAGAATVAYINGDLEATVEASPPRVVEASEAALKGMEIEVTSSEKSGIDGRVVGRSALNKKVEITVKRESDTTSKLSIRIDTFGDEALSRQIYDKIRAELK